MRRSEKILFEIDKRKYKADCPFDYEDGFKRGVKWADENPKEGMVSLEKVCSWIDDVDIGKYLSCIFSGAVNISFISDDFIRDLKKAMLEE